MAKKFTRKQIKNLPKYVRLKTDDSEGSGMRLYNPEENQEFGWVDDIVEYYKDGGDWSVDFRIDENDRIFSISNMNELNDIELIPISYTQWKKSNYGFIDKDTKAYSL